MIYVDELIAYPQKAASGGRYFGSGRQSCHLTADTPEELHAFAARLGLKRQWAQHEGRPTLHYDLTPRKRALALQFGAVEVSAREQARQRLKQRQP